MPSPERVRHGPLAFGLLSSGPLDPDLTRSWIRPLASKAIHRDLAKFARRGQRPASVVTTDSPPIPGSAGVCPHGRRPLITNVRAGQRPIAAATAQARAPSRMAYLAGQPRRGPDGV
ncbi:MAG: hypothetical protein ACRDNF_18980 [Streptosporangiaceae bacterium]